MGSLDRCRNCGTPNDGTFAHAGDPGVPVEDEDDEGYPMCPSCVVAINRRVDADLASQPRARFGADLDREP